MLRAIYTHQKQQINRPNHNYIDVCIKIYPIYRVNRYTHYTNTG